MFGNQCGSYRTIDAAEGTKVGKGGGKYEQEVFTKAWECLASCPSDDQDECSRFGVFLPGVGAKLIHFRVGGYFFSVYLPMQGKSPQEIRGFSSKNAEEFNKIIVYGIGHGEGPLLNVRELTCGTDEI